MEILDSDSESVFLNHLLKGDIWEEHSSIRDNK